MTEEFDSLMYLGSTNLRKMVERQKIILRGLQEKSNAGKNPRPYAINLDENNVESEIFKTECLIKELSALIDETEEKPCLIKNRDSDWIKKGDEVVVFNNGSNFTDIPGTVHKFIPGKVVSLNLPYILVRTDCKVYINNKGDNGDLLEFGLHSRFIYKKEEYDYLKNHPDYYDFWMQDSSPNDEKLLKMTETIKN